MGGPEARWLADNNWASGFTGTAWELDEASGQYYLHNFALGQPDLNWWNDEVRDAADEIQRFWFDRKVAGLRIDVARALIKDAQLRDNLLATEDDSWLRQQVGQQPTYSMNRPEVHDVAPVVRRLATLRTRTVRSCESFEDHGRLNAVAAPESLASGRGGRDRVKAVSKRCLRVDRFLQFREVAGPRAPQLFLKDHLQHHVARASRCGTWLGPGDGVLFDLVDHSAKTSGTRLRRSCLVGPVLPVPPALISRSVVVPARL